MVLDNEFAESVRSGASAAVESWLRGLERPEDINEVDSEGMTVLCLSAHGHETPDNVLAIRLVLAKGGADVNLADQDGWTPLHHACNANLNFGKVVIPLLIAAGADVNAKSTRQLNYSVKGETPLSTSIDWFRVSAQDAGGESIDDDSTKAGLEYVSLLLRHGASLDDCWAGSPAETLLRHIEDRKAPPAEIWSVEWEFECDIPVLSENEDFLACKALIKTARYEPRKKVLTLRALAIRGRAKTADPILDFVVNLPDGVAGNVLSFWPPRCDYLYLPASLYRPAPTYGGHRPGFVFKTRDGHTGYWLDDGSHKTPTPASWTQHVASYWAQRTPNTLGPPNYHLDLCAFADRTGLSAIADPEARREAAAQKADEITALLSI